MAAPALMLSAVHAALPPPGVPGLLVGVWAPPPLRQLPPTLALVGLPVSAHAAAAAAAAASCGPSGTCMGELPLLKGGCPACPAAERRVGVPSPPPPECDVRAPVALLLLCLGEPDCGVITPASAAATAAAGDE
jgi:hypothetical protein